MTFARVIVSRTLRRPASLGTTATPAADFNLLPTRTTHPFFSNPVRSFTFNSAAEFAIERRRRQLQRRLHIQPPFRDYHGSYYPIHPRPNRDPNKPESTSALNMGPRLTLHDRIQSLIRAGELDNASVEARQYVFSTVRPTVFTCNALIASMYRANRYLDAIALFTYFFKLFNIVPNIVSYNYLIISHCENGHVDKALEVYEHMKDNAPFTPSRVTFRHLTKGLIHAGRINEAVNLLWKMEIDGYGTDSHVFNNIIIGFLNLDNFEKANEFFNELKTRCMVYDGIVNATFMEWFFRKGKTKEAIKCYKSFLDEEFDIVPDTWNVLLWVLLKWDQKEEAEALFNSMLDRHVPPVYQGVDTDTFNIMVNECFRNGKGSEAYSVFTKTGKTDKSRRFGMGICGYNEANMLDDAEKMYVEMCDMFLDFDFNTYKILIDANFKAGRIDEAMEKFIKMVENGLGVSPTFKAGRTDKDMKEFVKMVDCGLGVIPSCAHRWLSNLIENGKIVECVYILSKMGERDPKPDASSYEIVIRALCGVCNYDASLCLLQQMIRYGVRVDRGLMEYVVEVFEKVGRKQEIEQYSNYSNRSKV